MAYNRIRLPTKCPSCGKQGMLVYEEDDQDGPSTRLTEATGCFRIASDGKPICECGERIA